MIPLFRNKLLLILLLFSAMSTAHHSVSNDFLPDQNAEVEGKVVRVWFRNPHVRYEIEAAKGGTAEIWELQWHNIPQLRKWGWDKNKLQLGDLIRAEGKLGRDGEKKIFISSVKWVEKTDGTRIAYTDLTRNAGKTDVAIGRKAEDYIAMPSKHPINITGMWDNGHKFRVTVNDLEPKPVPFTEQARRMYDEVTFGQDDALRCLSMGLPRIFGSPQPMEIVDAGTHYLIIYGEHNTPRWVWMDGRKPTEDTLATSMGFSTGHWQGEELVIETTDLTPGWLDGSGLPMSGEGTRIVETYTFSDDQLTMDRVMTINDPLYTQALTRVRGSARGNVQPMELPPCDPDSYYRDLWKKGMIDSRFN